MMPARPEQAVILAGGRGTRLRPLTYNTPKPMIKFHGRPFLEYLLELLKEQGFKRVLLLLGYLPASITNHFRNGERFGIDIEYDITDVNNDTGERLRLAVDKIEPNFLLMYCDNYWPLDFQLMWEQYVNAGKEALVTVYNNADGYSRDNIKLNSEGDVVIYDKSRSMEDLKGVDIGFLICRRSIIDLIPRDGNPSFEASVYPQLVTNHELAAFVTAHRYYSVGSHVRLPLTKAFLARKKTILIDRDGTLNVKMPPGEYVCSLDQWKWIPGALDALRMFNEAGYQVIIITNQPGIVRNKLTEATLETIHRKMISDAENAGGRIDAIYHCPHDRDAGCACRKPAPGLLFQAQREFDLDLSRLTYIGDDERDGEAAAAAGMAWLQVSDNYSVLDAANSYLAQNP